MLKCQIDWIDPISFKLTPDANPAVVLIRTTFKSLNATYPGHSIEPSESFPCCKDHLARMPKGGDWEVTEVIEPDFTD